LQFGDARFESRERVRYTRDQLLQLREVILKEIVMSAHISMRECPSRTNGDSFAIVPL